MTPAAMPEIARSVMERSPDLAIPHSAGVPSEGLPFFQSPVACENEPSIAMMRRETVKIAGTWLAQSSHLEHDHAAHTAPCFARHWEWLDAI
jgi:hypothetical protein